jgi:hypothetical protein
MKQLLFILTCVLSSSIAVGQYTSSKERPQWVDGFFQETTNSYIKVFSDAGYDENNAFNKAVKKIYEEHSRTTGQEVKVTIRDGEMKIIGEDQLIVRAHIIDEYRERYGAGEYRVHLLVQMAKNPSIPPEAIIFTDKYPFSPRVFVPGMAQLYKGSKAKGVLFIVGETALIGGIVAAESLRASYASKINTTHNATSMQNNINSADNWQNIRTGFIAGAVALYAWNVIDGSVAKGKKHVVILGDNTLRITPYITPYYGGASGVSLALHF